MSDAAARIARRRANAQLLHRPRGGTVEGTVRKMLAVQTQDPRTAQLGLRARIPKLTLAEIDAALARHGGVVATWLMRGTIHFVTHEDVQWLHALTAPRLRTQILKRLNDFGISETKAERATELLVAALADEGLMTRAELRERIEPHVTLTDRQAIAHVTGLAAVDGFIVMGPDRGPKRQYALWADWVGEPATVVDRDAALAELARRYLVTRGPATDRDFAAWAGLPLRDVRAGLEAIASEVEVDAGGAAVLKKAKERRGPSPLRFISTWDDLLLGWKDRPAWPEPSPFPRTKNSFGPGVGRPAIVVDGRAIGTYGVTTAGGNVEVTPELVPGAEVDPAALAAELADLERLFSGG